MRLKSRDWMLVVGLTAERRGREFLHDLFALCKGIGIGIFLFVAGEAGPGAIHLFQPETDHVGAGEAGRNSSRRATLSHDSEDQGIECARLVDSDLPVKTRSSEPIRGAPELSENARRRFIL